MWQNLQESADLATSTEEILNGKLHYLCGDKSRLLWQKGKITKFLDSRGNKTRGVYYFSDISVIWNPSISTLWTTEILRIPVTKNIQRKVLLILPLLHCFGWLKTSAEFFFFFQRAILKKAVKIYILSGFT